MSSENKISDTRIRILNSTWKLMEERRGQGVSMSDIAKGAGISRQALYLHFDSRTELMLATVQYVDEVKGLSERLVQFESATTGVELLDACVDVWGNYIPEIYGLAKALMSTRDTDEATAAAWNSGMTCLREVCQTIIDTLVKEGNLADKWTAAEAMELLFTLISIHNWEQLTIDSGWTNEQYVSKMKVLLHSTFIG